MISIILPLFLSFLGPNSCWSLLEPACRRTLTSHSRSLRGRVSEANEAPWGCEGVMSESPSVGGLKKGSTAGAQEGTNGKGNIVDIQYPTQYTASASVCIQMHPSRIRTHPYAPVCLNMFPYASFKHRHTNNQHLFLPKNKKWTDMQNCTNCIVTSSVKSIQIQTR